MTRLLIRSADIRAAFVRLVCLAAIAGLSLGACTVQRIEQDTAETLEWLRLKHGAERHSATRWQLPRHASILVVETTPAPAPDWAAAAQQGVDSVFPAPAAAGAHFQLLVSWPAGDDPAARPRPFLPDFQQPFALQVALVRSTDGALVEAATLAVSPRWLSGAAAGPDLVRQAFRRYAEGFRPGY